MKRIHTFIPNSRRWIAVGRHQGRARVHVGVPGHSAMTGARMDVAVLDAALRGGILHGTEDEDQDPYK